MISPFPLFVCVAICFVIATIALFLDAWERGKREEEKLKEVQSPFIKHFGVSEDV